jgi:gliding motility-associated-like protein
MLGCTATASVTVTVNTMPVVAFAPPYSSSCAPLAVQFMDMSSVVPANSVYFWQFGDGGTSTQQNPAYIYNNAGTYTVTLTVTSPAGCSSSVSGQAADVFPNPTAEFYVAPTITTLGNLTSFFDQSVPQIVTWNWNFGDGMGTSTIQHPTYTYSDTGAFTVTLVVTGPGGCIDSINATIYVRDDFFSLYVPNVFTPNHDGHNDLWIPIGIYERISTHVFDRWGEEVFSTSNVGDAWNGKFRDGKADCPNGTYVYMIDAWDVYDRVHHFIGKISIIR